jgi:hypothetical protein
MSTKHRTRTLMVAVAATGMIANAASAALIAYDSFGQAGDTVGSNLGNTTTTAGGKVWSPQSSVTDNKFTSPGLSYPQMATSGNAVALLGTTANTDRVIINGTTAGTFSSSGDLSTAYYSLLLSVPSEDLTGPARTQHKL